MRRLFALLACAALISGCTNAIAGRPTAPADLAWKQPIANAVANLGTAMGPVADAVVAGDYSRMHAGCTKMQNAIDGIALRLPTPDAAVNDALQGGVDNFRSFATLCATITPVDNQSDLDRLSRYLDRGDTRIREAFTLMGIEIPKR
ncbi:MAG TPA: hypothetical protein VE666_12440 [Mycobacterium sp.]|jgi:hypothetical protein|nr:hypothetical protein [Mycobacterium sp.]